MITSLQKVLVSTALIFSAAFFNYTQACTGSILAGNLVPTDNWQTVAGVQAGDRYTFTIGANEVIIFSFCQGGASYTNDPRIDLHNSAGTIVYDFNDDHCGYGAELVWLCATSGTYSVGIYDFFCLTNGAAMGTMSYKKLPTPTEQDCQGALPLCTSFTNHPQSYSGTGNYYDIFNFNAQQGMGATTNNCPNCLVTGELNNVWYTFTAQSNGNLAFTIDPVNNADDYDWALYSLNGGTDCFDLVNYSSYPPVSCNYAFVDTGNGNTGVGSGASGCVGPVADQGYNSTFAVTTGQTYVITVSNFSSTQNGYSINFGASTATIIDNSAPVLTNMVYQPYCGSSSITVQFSESVWCSSVQPSDFVLTGPDGTYSILDTYSIVCSSAASNTYAGTWYDDVWTLELGDLLSQSGDYTLTLNAGSVEDKCTNINAQNQIFFTVVGITADVDITNLAGCGGQCNGEISITNLSGGTAPYFINWSGPSGFTSTNAIISSLCQGQYTVTITDSEGICEYVEIVDLTGAPPINPTAANNGPLCQGQTLNLTSTSDDPASTFSWTGPAAFASGIQNPNRPASTTAMSGTYSLTVTDSYGCTETATTDVTIYSVTPISITTGSPYCEGENIQLNATTVIGASYSWTGPGVFSSAVEDPQIPNCVVTDGGAYSVTVTDANSCTATANTNIVVNPGITANVVAVNPLCYQQPSGQITVNVTNGTPNYTYAWSNGPTINTTTNCVGGTSYCVTIQDASGCSLEVCHTLTDPAEIVVTSATVPTQCGFLDGEITLTISGGAGGYTIPWTEGHNGDHITGLHPGDYTATVTDANGCQEIVTATVGFFGAGTVAIAEIQSIKCYGDANAVLNATMTGGTIPFDYTWSVSGQTSANLAGIGAGTYTVSVEDVYGCSGQASWDVAQPPMLTLLIDHTDVLCRGGNNGNATANVSGGVFPYTYNCDHGPTSSHISSLIAGTYNVNVTDLNGCPLSDFVVINQPDKATAINLTTTGVTCAGKFDGTASVIGDGGTPPYSIYWFQYGTLIASAQEVQSLRSGNYSVEMFDANNCMDEVNFVITEPSELIIGSQMSPVTCKGFNDGMIAISIEGGTFPYSFSWNTGDTLPIVADLIAGQYIITVTDASNCIKTIGIDMPESIRLCLGIPDAFTPNADGINDTWEIEYIEMYPGSYVNVFNRWGQHIYQGVPGSEFWDGKFNGKFVPAGAYQYVVDLRNGMEPFTGVVVVVY